MGVFVKGEVITLPFPFTDLQTTKIRPALVVLAVPKIDELVVCQITTRPSRLDYTIPLLASDFEYGGLKFDSYIRPNHINTADPAIVQTSEGKLKSEKLQEVLDAIIRILKEK